MDHPIKQLCKFCNEPLTIGQHRIRADISHNLISSDCVKCKTKTYPVCILGTGNYVYVCKCGHKWSNI